jgi:hypothetical protein
MRNRFAARGALLVASSVIIASAVACGTKSDEDGSPSNPGQSGTGAVPASGGAGTGAAPGAGGDFGSGATPGVGGGSGGSGATPGSGGAGAWTGTTGGTGGGTVDPSQNDCAPDKTGAVTFSVPSGTFQGQLSVELSAVAGEIRYTTDRTEPTVSSQLYSEAIPVTATTQIRALAFVDGVAAGPVGTALYVARAFDKTHDVPVVVLDSYGQGKLDSMAREFEDVAVMAWPAAAATLSGAPETASHAGYHVRGQSSSYFEKAPYRVELRDGSNEDKDCPVLGMPEESDWALIASFPDKALIRNAFVYDLGRDIGLTSPQVRFAEVYLNHEARPLAETDYVGLYQVVETIKNQKNRLNLQQLEETDVGLPTISGGYIFKFEWRAAEAPLITCTGAQATCFRDLEVVDPNPITAEQNTYLTQHLVAFNDVLHSATLADPSTGYRSYIDVPSFVNHVIVNEITRNMDAYIRSQYFHKDRDGKIVAGPLWDFDLTMGVGGYFENDLAEGWQYEQALERDQYSSDWFNKLIAEPAFRTELVARYQELRQGALSEAQIDTRIAKVSAGLGPAAARNFARWPILTSECVPEAQNPGPGPIPGGGPCPLGNGPSFKTSTADTWEGQVQAMRTWLLQRLAWLDTQWQ